VPSEKGPIMLLKSSQATSSSGLLSFGTPEKTHYQKSEKTRLNQNLYMSFVEAADAKAVVKELC